MKTSDFDYVLPAGLIAQTPLEQRDQSRLLVLNRATGSIEHHHFSEIVDYLTAKDVLVFNDTRVIPARIYGKKTGSGGRTEILLLRRMENGDWEALVKPGKRLTPGTCIEISRNGSAMVTAEIGEYREDGVRLVRFSDETLLPQLGNVPLPPYIHTSLDNPERYQTIYARVDGSAAAPTAGLHFTPRLFDKMQAKGIKCLFVTLHVGLDTFRPVKEDNPLDHHIHREYGILSPQVAEEISQAKSSGGRVICVGTTTTRIVEQAGQNSADGQVQPFEGWVSLFILPGYQFRVTDAMMTNFHLPKSTLLMLVSAFAGKELIQKAYTAAVAEKYRFYSFGDAMLII